jgi:hypothetical protein
MASSDNSVITGKLKGSLGKQLVFREWNGKTIVAKSPKSRSGVAPAVQLEKQDRFLMASRYAKAVMADPDQSLAEAYKGSLKNRQNLYSRALEDFMTKPEIKSINTDNYRGEVGDMIVIRAIDDFRVTELRIEIFKADGSLLESGNAVPHSYGLDWTYTATQANPAPAGSGTRIKATASDVPGNKTSEEIIMS